MPEPTSTSPAAASLQFDRAVSTAGADSDGARCGACGRAIRMAYYTVGDKAYCPSCKAAVDEKFSAANETARFTKSIVYGCGSALAGAAIYFAVMVFLHLEIGLIAILIGYMVAKAIRKAAIAGGQKYQILAVALTYAAVGLAYCAALGSFGGFVYPVTNIASGGGILSAIIIAFGLRQAWRMTRGISVTFVGPLRVAQPATASSAASPA